MSATNIITTVDGRLIDDLCQHAHNTPRNRLNYNLHCLTDPYQRFVNAIHAKSYMRPHRHSDDETFIILEGSCAVLFFGDGGYLISVYILDRDKRNYIVDIPACVWHTLFTVVDDTVIFEAKAGPYVPTTAKEFAPWAPDEADVEASEIFMNQWLKYIMIIIGKGHFMNAT